MGYFFLKLSSKGLVADICNCFLCTVEARRSMFKTMAQRYTDYNNQLIIRSEQTQTYIRYERLICNLSIKII